MAYGSVTLPPPQVISSCTGLRFCQDQARKDLREQPRVPSRPVAHGSSGGCKYFPGLRGGQQRARPLMLQEQHPTDPGHCFHSAHCHLPQWDRHSPHNNKITGTASGKELSVRTRMIETFVNSQNSTFRWQRLSFSKQIEKKSELKDFKLLSIDLIHFKMNEYSLGVNSEW